MKTIKDYPLSMRILNQVGGVAFYSIAIGLILQIFFKWGYKVSLVGLIVFITLTINLLAMKASYDKKEDK